MKKFTKCLAVFTLAFMILSGIPNCPVTAANTGTGVTYSEADKESFKYSFRFYETLGVVNESLNIDSTIPRGLWADIVLRYFGREGAIDYYRDIHFFDDYDSKYDKIGSVNLAAELGLMGEYDDGKFCPQTDVSYEDACVSVVKGLGYDFLVQSRGGGVDQYLILANELGLLKGVTASRGYPIVASAALKMLDNALDTQVLGKVLGNGDEIYKQGDTVLSGIHKLIEREGIVTSDFRSSLHSHDKVGSDQIGIDNTVYSYSGEKDGLLGYRVRYYIDAKDQDVVVYLGRIKNNVDIIDFDDVYDYRSRTYYYLTPNSEKERKWEIPRDCAILYNGVAIRDGFLSDLPMFTDDGSLTLINNDSDADVDVLLIEAYTDFWVGHIDVTSETLYSNYDAKDHIALGDYDVVEIYDSYGAETTLSKISVKNVLSVAKTPDGKSIRLDLSTETVEGEIEKLRTENRKKTVTVDGIDYSIGSVCDDADLTVGFSGVFYLNKNGRIVASDEKIAALTGYLISADAEDSIKKEVSLQILTTSGEVKVFPCAERVTVVGESSKYKNSELYRLLLNGEAKVAPQAVLYGLNQNGEVNSLDLVGHSERIREGDPIKGSAIQYRTSAACFTNGKTFLNGGATIFYVPMNGGDIEDYGVLARSEMQNEGHYSSDNLSAYTYQVDGSQLGVDILVVDESFRSRKYGLGIIKEITELTNDEGERGYEIKIYQYSNLVTYYLDPDDFDISSVSAASAAFTARELEEGDVVGLDYILDSGNRILSRLSIIYDISRDEYLYSNPSITGYSGVTRYFFGDVQTKDNKLIAMVLRGGTMAVDEETAVGDTVDRAARNYEIHPAGGSVYVYDSSRKKDNVIKGSVNDIAAYDTVGEEYSTVWVFTSNENTQMIYVVNK